MRPRSLLVLLVLLGLPSFAGAPRRSLSVAAAANLKGAVEELAAGFEAANPGVDVLLTLGASGALFSQLKNGAPFDLFLSADREYPSRLVEARLGAAAEERVYAIGTLVAWRPAGSKVDLERQGLAALAQASVKRVAIANPAVAPFGRATVAALEAAGVHAAIKDKLVLGTSVAQAAQFATTGAADVAFLPASLAMAKELAGGAVYVVPAALYPRLEQSGLVLAGAKEPELARAFLASLTSPQGRAVLARYGYGLP